MPAYPSLPRDARVVVDADGVHIEPGGDDDVADARSRFKQRHADAWRGPDRATGNTLDHIKRKKQLSEAWKHDAGRGPYGAVPSTPEEAYAARSERLASAWQGVAAGGPTPRAPKANDPDWITPVGGRRKYKAGLPEYDKDSADSQPTVYFDDDDPQARRDQANVAYVDRIRNAWRS